MLDIIYSVATSLDGFIATPEGRVDWLSQFHALGEDYGAGELEKSVDALLLGSRTYEFALTLGQWPSPHKRSWVFTHRKLRLLHPSITLTSQDPHEVVGLISAQGARRAWLMGGGALAASFQAAGLISRYAISVFPILLGSGIPFLRPATSAPKTLRLLEATPFQTGVVQLTYERAGDA